MSAIEIATREQAEQFAKSLSAQQREWMRGALRRIDEGQLAGDIIAVVRAWYEANADPEDPAYAIVFQASDWDNGWFVWSRTAALHYASGERNDVLELDDATAQRLDALFTDLFDKVNDRFEVAVDLRDWSLHDEENGDVLDLLPKPVAHQN